MAPADCATAGVKHTRDSLMLLGKVTTALIVVLFSACSLIPHKINRDDSVAQISFNNALKEYGFIAIDHLKTGQQEELIAYIEALELASYKDPEQELRLDYELNSFGATREKLDALLNDLVENYPNSHMSWQLRAHYFLGKAWQSRGEKFINEVTKKQIDGMNHYRSKALSDISSALKIKPENFSAYLLKAQSHIVSRKEHAVAMASFEKALELLPYSYSVRNILLHNLTPRWGGSIEKMQEVLVEAKTHYGLNPLLKVLESTLIEEEADSKLRSNKHLASDLYLRAIEVGDRARPRTDLAELQLLKGKKVEACLNIDKAIELNPPRWSAHQLVVNCQ